MQESLKNSKSIPLLNENEIKYIQTPVGQAIYKNSFGRPKKKDYEKAKPSDRLTCSICGGKFIRSHRSSHNKSKVHQAYLNMDNKLKKLLLDTDKDNN
jgi:hypothetical protein